MTPEEAKALRIAAATIRNAEQPALALAFEGRGYLERIRALEIEEQKKGAAGRRAQRNPILPEGPRRPRVAVLPRALDRPLYR